MGQSCGADNFNVDAERAKFIVEKVWERTGKFAQQLTVCTGGARTPGCGHPRRRRGRGGGDDIAGFGQGRGGVCDVPKDRGEQGDCAVAGGEPERDIYSERGRECAVERACAEVGVGRDVIGLVPAIIGLYGLRLWQGGFGFAGPSD